MILDLTDCKSERIARVFGDYRKISVEPGIHTKDLDVVMDELPSALRTKLVADAISRAAEDPDLSMPIGFNVGSLPAGAVIKVTQ